MNLPPSAGKQARQYHQHQGSPVQNRPHSSQSHRRAGTPRATQQIERYNTPIQRPIQHEASFEAQTSAGLHTSVQIQQQASQSFQVAQQYQHQPSPEKTLKSTSNEVQAELYRRAAAAASGHVPSNAPAGATSNPQNSYFGQTQPTYRPSNLPYTYTPYTTPTNSTMSLSYESRGFMPDTSNYPQMEQVEDFKEHRYPSPPRIDPQMSDNPYHTQNLGPSPDEQVAMDLSELQQKEDSEPSSPGRSKPIPKPVRDETKDPKTGRYFCAWPGCTEEVKDFGRKCEWSKHMDKHDRPYRCLEIGCEKLPGFTYSGGLLRHEREVHNKHGGPRKQLNCPHPNCKRHTGKGFSRQENLNEHLRRVHTDMGSLPPPEEIMEEDETKTGAKRKRAPAPMVRDTDGDLREEMKRLRQENEELRRQSEAQNAQTAEMMRQLSQLQQSLNASMQHRLQAPQAPMM